MTQTNTSSSKIQSIAPSNRLARRSGPCFGEFRCLASLPLHGLLQLVSCAKQSCIFEPSILGVFSDTPFWVWLLLPPKWSDSFWSLDKPIAKMAAILRNKQRLAAKATAHFAAMTLTFKVQRRLHVLKKPTYVPF